MVFYNINTTNQKRLHSNSTILNFKMISQRRALQPVSAVLITILLLQMKAVLGAFNSTSGDSKAIRCIDSEREALLMFKQALTDEFNRLSSWGRNEVKRECCNWEGVLCSPETGHVTVLNLYYNESYKPLRGKLSPSLFELKHLTYLDLSLNHFMYSSIPNSIGSLNKLKHLAISSSALGGSLPTQLANLTSLQFLDLGINEFHSVKNLDWLSHLSSLKYLRLTGLDHSQTNDWLQVLNKLPNLKEVDLRGCQLLDVPPKYIPVINASTSLAILDLGFNNLTASTFKWVFSFSSSLVYLDLSLNQIKGLIPEALVTMTSLEQLRLDVNQLEGGIPKSFGSMCNLKQLHLYENKLKGMLSDFIHNISGCLQFSLETLDLEKNQIMGSLPDDLTKFSSLRKLSLSKNGLNGTLPERIGLLSKLELLDISSNIITGVIFEAHFSNLSKLQYLDLSFNPLEMKFSHDWVPPFQLDYIGLGSCKLGPAFPNWIQTQRTFSFLDISNNGISGKIPEWLWDISPRVASLKLSSNKFHGGLPDLSKKLLGYPGIDLSSNYLEGPLPIFPVNTTSLNLSNNTFSGLIASLCTITNFTVTFLDLSNNRLSGEVPDCIMRWQSLNIVNLANNRLSGKIPDSVGSYCWFQTFNLRNNSFSGELPSSLGNCRMLQFLDLSYNRFSVEIPAWLGEKLTSLAFLILKSNDFHGSIPLQLCQLRSLQLLDLSVNRLSGNIPQCINNLTALFIKKTFSGTYHYLSSFIDWNSQAYGDDYVDKASFTWKGKVYDYRNLTDLRVVDLSSNKLTGKIPRQIWSLLELLQLNLSRNQLSGSIFEDIGKMRSLDSLDLSRNKLSGRIPGRMAELNFLGYLDLSDNNFSGRIPTDTRFQRFDALAFAGNPALCGPPLPDCLEDKASSGSHPGDQEDDGNVDEEEEEDDEFWKTFYSGMGLGLASAFAITFCLQLNQSWRHACFNFFHSVKDCISMTVVVLPWVLKLHLARIWRKFYV